MIVSFNYAESNTLIVISLGIELSNILESTFNLPLLQSVRLEQHNVR